ncbi:OprO/OprP family phosphate-selective porin [Lignipirellula cremea]|uniref:Porin P n=1 Tax=Lignipirellula cremea TaxID=2528010 RepID=A0A518DZV4_9BACT|nr:porin [Lignipirellula cremea]QDU97368.1 Porin P precursor [Lignipirellula cremea]
MPRCAPPWYGCHADRRIRSAGIFFSFALLLCAGLLGGPSLVRGQETVQVPAQDDSEVLRELRKLQAEIEQLKGRQDRLERLPAIDGEGRPAPPPESCESGLQFHCDDWCNGSSAAAAAAKAAGGKYPTVKLTGFFQADAAWFHQDAANMAALAAPGENGDIQDGADFRRARLAAVGDAYENVGYMLEMDFAFPGRPSFMDVWFEIRDTVGPGTIRFGQFRQPIGMDGLTSVKELTFLERALPFAFLPFRQIGVMNYGHAENNRATWAVSAFRFPTDVYGGNVGDNGGFGGALRLTALPIDHGDGNSVLHVGGGYSYIDPANDLVRYRNQPEIFVGETGAGVTPANVPTNVPAFVDTGAIATSHVNMGNAELGYSVGSFHAQSEAYITQVNRLGPSPVTFYGAYAQAGYILTGENLPYNRQAGVFGRIKPRCPFTRCGGYGAWEVAGRWSTIDLNDNDIAGGRLNDLTLGLNWYLNNNTKFQFNYIHAFLNSSAGAVNPPTIYGSDADIFAFRGQVDF